MLFLGLSLRLSKKTHANYQSLKYKARADRKALYDKQLRQLEIKKWKNIFSTFLLSIGFVHLHEQAWYKLFLYLISGICELSWKNQNCAIYHVRAFRNPQHIDSLNV